MLKHVPFGPGKEVSRIIPRFQAYAEESVQRYWRQLREDPENTKPTLLTKEYARVEDGMITASQIRRDAVGNIAAVQIPPLRQQLPLSGCSCGILRSNKISFGKFQTLPMDFTDEHLRSLQLLGNVINETLRLRGPIEQCLPRYVTAGGVEFCGHFIPEGKVVGSSSIYNAPQA